VKQAGWKVYFYPNTRIVHIGGESAKTDAALSSAGRQITSLQAESELLYFRKHYGLPGLTAWIALTGCGALLSLLKNAVRSNGKASAAQEKWAVVRSLLKPTRWATQPTR
jgi:hypothetical protein